MLPVCALFLRLVYLCVYMSPYAFSALTLLVGWQEGHLACRKLEWWCTGMVMFLERDADLHMAQLMPLPLTVSAVKSRFVLPFWYRLTWVVPRKRAVKLVCVCVCVICYYICRTMEQQKLQKEPSLCCISAVSNCHCPVSSDRQHLCCGGCL